MKKFLCLLLLFMVFGLTSCSHIEDTNGPDDYSLETFSDEDIIYGSSTSTTFMVLETYSVLNGKSTGSYSVGKLSGVITVLEDDWSNRKLKFDIKFTCESGNAVVAVVSNNQIVRKIEANQDVIFEVVNSGYEYEIVLVGESAKVELKYEITSFN